MADQTITCARCGEEFRWTDSQQAYYAANGLSAPRKCKGCRKLKSYTQEELEQDLFIIETARHIARTQLVEGAMGGLQFNRVMDRLDAEEKRCTNRALMQKLDWIAGRQNAQRRQNSTSTPARRQAMLTQMEREKPQTFERVREQRAKE